MIRAGIARAAAIAVAAWVVSSAAGAQTEPSSSPFAGREVNSTIIPGAGVTPPPPPPRQALRDGPVNLNFPAVDVRSVAQAILGDTLRLPFAVDPSVQGTITVETPRPIQRADVLAFFEQALTNANLALVQRAGVYTVVPGGVARGEAPVVGPADTGFGNEAVELKFVNADQLRQLLDPLVPNAVALGDPTRNVLVISGNEVQRRALRELIAQFDVDWLRGMSFAMYVPQRTDARLIAPELDKLLNAPGSPSAGLVRLITMDRLNGILAISSQAQYLEDARRFIEVLDREGESSERRMFVYHVQNGRAADLTKVLDGAFGIATSKEATTNIEPAQINDVSGPPAPTVQSPANGFNQGLSARAPGAAVDSGRGTGNQQQPSTGPDAITITADEVNNAIVVYATPRNYAVIEDALRKLDVPPLQVMIDASVSEVTLNHALQYGLQWSFTSGNSSGALTQPNNVTGVANSTPQQNFPGFSYLYSGMNFQATFNALAQLTDVHVLSAPKLMVLNNHTATIDVGDEVPISTGSAVSTETAGAPIVNSIDYREVGVILKITPRVNSGGLVLLDIAQEVSGVLPQAETSANSGSGIVSPTFEERKIATSIAVQDGQTVALGGLIKNEVDKGRSTIPLLGSIPILGHLFGDTTGTLVRTELIVLLTPHVVRTPVDAQAITDELKSKIEMAAPPPPPPPPQPPKTKKKSGAG
jgi:general secretion pathway protein D